MRALRAAAGQAAAPARRDATAREVAGLWLGLANPNPNPYPNPNPNPHPNHERWPASASLASLGLAAPRRRADGSHGRDWATPMLAHWEVRVRVRVTVRVSEP